MCGIIGYTGKKDAVNILIQGLDALEYRGYDSAGISVFCGNNIKTVKSKGRLANTKDILDREKLFSNCGIGHTRWATHGEPSDVNAHPHTKGKTTIVHNGIIENYASIRRELAAKYTFESETDTEAACALIDDLYSETGDPLLAIEKAVEILRGSYAFGIMFSDRPGCIYAVRHDSPLIVARDENGSYLASDIPAILTKSKHFYRPDKETAVLSENGIEFYLGTKKTEVAPFEVTWDIASAQKCGFPHFMIKEIHDEPDVIKKSMSAYITNDQPSEVFDVIKDGAGRIVIVACGTAMHAGLIAKHLIEGAARICVTVETASEFRYNDPIISSKDLVILVSQSGETADTLAALRLAKQRGARTLSIVNVVGSSVARESEDVIYTLAGPEIAVASTKAYSAQLCVFYLIAAKLAFLGKALSEEELHAYCKELKDEIPKAVSQIIAAEDMIKDIAQKYKDSRDVFFIGRGIDYYLCEEASLKLKEVSYIHSEAYPAGELKHGTISLITEEVLSVAIVTSKKVYDKMISNIKEIRARGGKILIIAASDFDCPPDIYDDIIRLPKTGEKFSPFTTAAVFQLLAYHISAARGCDVDKPRNLAKSVTVE